MFRAWVSEWLAAAAADISALYDRMTTEYEEELRECEEENERKQQLLDQLLNPRVLLQRVAPCPGPNHNFTETPPIKEEPEEQLPEPVPESSAVYVIKERSSLLQNRQFEHSEVLTEHSDDTDTDEDWKSPLSCSDSQMETEIAADHYNQFQAKNRSAKPSPKNKSVPETSATVHKGDLTRPDGGARNKLQCSVCTKTFKTKNKLQRHTRVHTGEKPFRCSFCDKTFSLKRYLETHRRTHTGEKPFRCSVCDKTFSLKRYLETHRRTHTGEKPFRCSVCDKTFAQRSTLGRHRRTHTGEKPFRCSFCDMTFSQKCNLERHRRTHTGKKPFRCSFCDKTFAQKPTLETHRRTHTGDEPFRCPVRSFTHKSNLKLHMSTHNI